MDKSVQRVGIVGAGTMGREIALQIALAGLDTVIYDSSPMQLEALPQLLRKRIEPLQNMGGQGLSQVQIDEALGRLTITGRLEDLAEVDLISESVFEELAVKQTVWSELGAICASHTLFTTNTSSLAPSSYAQATGRPDRFAAMHFHLPIEVNRIVDVMTNGKTSVRTMDQVQAFVEKIGMIPIRIEKESPAYLFNAMLIGYMREAIKLLVNEIGSKEDIDQVWTSITGVGAGPFVSMDYVGIDTVWRIIHGIAEREQDDKLKKCADYLKQMVDAGKLGMKTGSGFYDYPELP